MPLDVDVIAELGDIFETQGWPTSNASDTFGTGPSRFANFCKMFEQLGRDEQILMLDLTRRFLKRSMADYEPLLKDAILQLKPGDLGAGQEVIVVPLKDPSHAGEIKSGTMVTYLAKDRLQHLPLFNLTRLSDPLMLDVAPGPWAIAEHRPHTIVLTSAVIRELTKPVEIPWPGVTYAEAAKRLGRTVESLYSWVTQGVFRIERSREYGYPENGKRRGPLPRGPRGEEILARERAEEARRNANPRNLWNQRFTGGGRPYVWTPSPIDPNNFHGRAPHAVWGTLWQWHWEKMPCGFAQEVLRVPRYRTQGNPPRPRFLGWQFVCPGRVTRNGEHTGCGKQCTYLYGPQTVWTLAKAIGEEGFDLPPAEDCGLAGQWFPGLADTVAQRGTRSFACKHCWSVRSACMANDSGWNEFITHVSGGLLCGRDVPRPMDICPMKRKKREYKWRVRGGEVSEVAVTASA